MLAISKELVIVSPLSRESTVGTLDGTVFRGMRDLIPFHEFLILFKFLSEYHSKQGFPHLLRTWEGGAVQKLMGWERGLESLYGGAWRAENVVEKYL